VSRGVLIGILFLGLAEFSYGFWIPAKAWLSQVLLAQAWQSSQRDQTVHKPWPWADTWPVFKLIVEDTGQSLFVLQGDTGQALAFGPGFNPQSHRPGKSGNTIISAHRDTHFGFLADVEIGQQLQLEDTNGRRHSYVVAGLDIVDSRKNRIQIDDENDLLTLVTCYPFKRILPGGHLRYLVTGISQKQQSI
jgi:sortase A